MYRAIVLSFLMNGTNVPQGQFQVWFTERSLFERIGRVLGTGSPFLVQEDLAEVIDDLVTDGQVCLVNGVLVVTERGYSEHVGGTFANNFNSLVSSSPACAA